MTVTENLLFPLSTPRNYEQALPPLPSPPRTPAFSNRVLSSYNLSTHLFPAAFPRSTPQIQAPVLDISQSSPDVRKAEVKKAVANVLESRIRYDRGDFEQERDSRALWICVNRYVRASEVGGSEGGDGLTLIMSQANGFPKETWEHVLDHVLVNSITSGPRIDEIWCLDAVQHGDSALLNAGNLSGLYNWKDHARDLLHFLLHYLPDTASSSALPVHLSRHSDEVATYRTSIGFLNRTIIGLGHSFGAISTLFAALVHPALFKSLVLIEAVVGEPLTSAEEAAKTGLPRIVAPTISRPSIWSSMDEARKSLSAFPVFRGFDKSQIDVYSETAVHALPDGRVALKQNPVQEAIVFEVCAPAHAWTHAPFLDEKVGVHWVRGTRPSVFSGTKEAGDKFVQRVASRRQGRGVSQGWVDGGHLVVQENPKATGNEISSFLKRKHTKKAKL